MAVETSTATTATRSETATTATTATGRSAGQKGDSVSTETEPPALDVELVSAIRTWIERFVALPSAAHGLVIAVWVLHTWLFEAFHVTPYLYIYSKHPASGKTRLLEVLNILCRNARRADDMTPSVMFKLIAREGPTLLIDEADTIWAGSRNDPKRRICCTGYRKGGSAWREQARELIEFPTFCAKVLCGLNNGFMPETVRSRCIPVEMERKPASSQVERFNEHQVANSRDVERLFDRIMLFREHFLVDVMVQRPYGIPELSDRQDEIVEPLLAIAAVFGLEADLREAIKSIFSSTAKSTPNPQQTVLRRLRDAFGTQDRMWTEELCGFLGSSYNGRNLAMWLEPYGIAPRDVRIGNTVLKGYLRADFESAWQVYLGEGADVVDIDSARKEVA